MPRRSVGHVPRRELGNPLVKIPLPKSLQQFLHGRLIVQILQFNQLVRNAAVRIRFAVLEAETRNLDLDHLAGGERPGARCRDAARRVRFGSDLSVRWPFRRWPTVRPVTHPVPGNRLGKVHS